MIQYKKLMMTLALLLTAVTGAWADGIVCTASDLGKVLCIDGSIYENVSAATTAGKTAAAVIVYVDETNKYGLAIALADESNYMNMSTAKSYCESKTAIKGAKWCLPSQDQWKQMFKANGGNEGSYTGLNTTITTAGGTALEGYASYWSSTEYDPGVFAYLVDLSDGDVSWYYDHEGLGRQFRACLAITDAIEVTPVAEPAANTKQWTFTQPGSDVVLTPIYAKTAAFATTGTEPEVTTLLPAAAEGVIAGTYAPLIVEGTVAKAGETENPQGTVMYAVTAATATAAPALTSSDWKTTVPTAKDIADGGAELLVWYYIQGADAPANVAATLDNTFNNSDVCATPLTVSVRSNKFDLTFNAANANTIEAGMATVTVDGQPATVTDGKLEAIKMGSEVKMTAAQGYKFRKVEVKKEAAPLIVNPVVGQYIGSDGKNYDALPDGVTAVAKICYVGSETGEDAPYNHGLALALSDASTDCEWSTSTTDAGHTKQTSSTFTEESGLQYNATHNSDTYPAFKAAITYSPAAPTGCSAWFLASAYQWQKMFGAVGLSNLGLQEGTCFYWSSTEYNADYAWVFSSLNGGYWGYSDKVNRVPLVRACLAF